MRGLGSGGKSGGHVFPALPPKRRFAILAGMVDTAAREIRWFHFKPGRLVIVPLIVDGLFWLSEHFQWFGFNAHKGWTVLIAVASVSVFLLAVLSWLILARLWGLRFQFSLRSLLVLTVAVALPFSWLGVEMKKSREQNAAVEKIEKVGGQVFYGDWWAKRGRPSGTAWLLDILGDDFFAEVDEVCLDATNVTDAGLENLRGLTAIRMLELRGDSLVSDTGLENIRGLSKLKYLNLGGTYVSDAALEKLGGLTALETCARTKSSLDGWGRLKGIGFFRFPFPWRSYGSYLARPQSPGVATAVAAI